MPTLIPSWLPSANEPGCPFPVNNLPCGVFSLKGSAPRCGVAIGDHVLDLVEIATIGLIPQAPEVFDRAGWNSFMKLGAKQWRSLRTSLTELLRESGSPKLSGDKELCEKALLPLGQVTLHAPFEVTEFTDFYSSRHHAQNAGELFRDPENALPPNWRHIPIGYNGRASSVVASGTDIRRPWGQIVPQGAEVPIFEPTRAFDFELELGAIIGSPLDGPATVQQADDVIFGYVLLNDWSARDIQRWEYQPLGPFQAKATATTIGQWIVSKTALEPFRTAAAPRDIPLLPYLKEPGPMLYDIDLSLSLIEQDGSQTELANTNFRHMYYSAPQQIAHHTACGCPMRVGDLIGSGTISGPTPDSLGCMLEITKGGRSPIDLSSGRPRSFVEDGDTIRIGGAVRSREVTIGFGECVGRILPAVDWSTLA